MKYWLDLAINYNGTALIELGKIVKLVNLVNSLNLLSYLRVNCNKVNAIYLEIKEQWNIEGKEKELQDEHPDLFYIR